MKAVTGSWELPNGTPVANGTVYFKLNQDAAVVGVYQVAPRIISFPLNPSGFLNGVILANDELLPALTTYTITVNEAGGGKVWGPETFYLSGVSININLLVPLAQNAAFTPVSPPPGYGTGAAVTSANFVISGWGVGASISNIVGVQQRCSITVTAGIGGSLEPTVTFTYPGAYATASFNLAQMIGGTGVGSDVDSLPSTTGSVFTYIGQPQAGQTYIFVFDTVGI